MQMMHNVMSDTLLAQSPRLPSSTVASKVGCRYLKRHRIALLLSETNISTTFVMSTS
jgi:hypothetical protein